MMKKTINVNVNEDQRSKISWIGEVVEITIPNEIPGFNISVRNNNNGVVINAMTDGELIKKKICI